MIIPDLNLLLYAYNADAPHHVRARAWWEGLLNGRDPVGLPWVVGLGFIRLMTNPAVLVSPVTPAIALAHVEAWVNRPQVEIVNPGPRHLEILGILFQAAGVASNLTTDAHLAALAIENQCELHSNDTDFARFSGLRWRNPL